jgi:hypothetical protein
LSASKRAGKATAGGIADYQGTMDEYDYDDLRDQGTMDEYDYDDLRDRMIEDTLRSQSEEAVRWRLATVGDAIEARVRRCLIQAEKLLQLSFYGPSLVSSVSAIELTIRFLLVKPLISGAFLSDQWASLLTERIGSGRTDEDRRILPNILSQWGFDLDSIMLGDGEKLWSTLVNPKTGILAARNRIVHQGAEIDEPTARRAVECAKSMIDDLVRRVAQRFKFALERTGCWYKSKNDYGDTWGVGPWDPIERKTLSVPIGACKCFDWAARSARTTQSTSPRRWWQPINDAAWTLRRMRPMWDASVAPFSVK